MTAALRSASGTPRLGLTRGVRRSGNVQGAQEPAQADRSVPQVSRRIPCGNLPGQERDDTPRPRVAGAWPPDPHGHRNWQRQPRLKNREPTLFVHEEPGGDLTPRQPGRQHVADPAHNIVPPVRSHLDSQVGKVGLLGGQEPLNQVRGDVHFGGRHAVRTHPATLAEP